MRRIVILGSTGSIGRQALDVVERSGGQLEVVALAARRSSDALVEQARAHGVARIALADEHAAARASEAWTGGEVLAGAEGLVRLITETDCDLVLNALAGAAGVGPSVAALGEGIDLALANRESLVVAGDLVMALAEATSTAIIPVHPDHSGLHQLISGERPGTIDRLTLTAAPGGTLMDTGFDVIAATHLFGVAPDDVEVLLHPERVVHALVQLNDGASLAHLGYPDMRVPISYALNHPERVDTPVEPLDLAALGGLTFAAPDLDAYPCLGLAYDAARAGGTAPCVLQAAYEVDPRAEVIERTLAAVEVTPVRHFSDLYRADEQARDFAAVAA
jgi:1-deoxy-D-xylulose-5-phosphate reductoisomerase